MSSSLPAHWGDSVCVTQVELPPPTTLFLVSTFARKMESEGIVDVGPKQMAWARSALSSEVAQALWEPARKNH